MNAKNFFNVINDRNDFMIITLICPKQYEQIMENYINFLNCCACSIQIHKIITHDYSTCKNQKFITNHSINKIKASDAIIVINENFKVNQSTTLCLIEAYKENKLVLYTNYETSEGEYIFNNNKYYPLYSGYYKNKED